MDIYVALALLGIGYFINNKKPRIIPSSTPTPSLPLPSMQNIYNSINTMNVKKEESESIKKHNESVIEQVQKSNLSGEPSDFKHTNMMPFIRGNMKQNVDSRANVGILERYGSKNDVQFRKKEIAGMFVPEANVNRFDPNTLDDLTYRVSKPKVRNNILPFEQIKVGKGIDQGYGSEPTGGFQQTNIVDLIMPKNVDELRTANNPKMGGTENRIVEGQKGKNRGIIGQVDKNRPDTSFEMNHDRLMKTTGAVLGAQQKPVPEAKETARQTTTSSYSGAAHRAMGTEQRGDVLQPNRKDVQSGFDPSNVRGQNKKAGDYGKGSVQIYTNSRDITTTQTRKSNLQSIVKAITAPIIDALKPNKKEWFVESAREFGDMNAQIPSKLTVRDTNDVLRTTIKETTVQNTENMNIKGPIKLTIYDPVDVARTTTRQTTMQDTDNMNMKAPVYKNVIYDPNDVAKTTIKETLLQQTECANIKTSQINTQNRNADDKSRSTIRETLDYSETNLNMAGNNVAFKGVVYDPNNIAKTTIKETVVNGDNIGIASGVKTIGAYADTDFSFDFKNTQKETYTDKDYFGGAQIGLGGEGYQDANFDPKMTMKETTTGQYFGSAESTTSFAQMNDSGDQTKIRIPTLVERDPTQSGVKMSNSINNQGTIDLSKKQALENNNINSQRDHIISSISTKTNGELTKTRQFVQTDNERLDMEILEPFRKNPFTQSLHSVA